MGIHYSYAQNTRYVEWNSKHSLFVPENPDYSYEWTLTWGGNNQQIPIYSTTNVTDTISWDRPDTRYKVSVRPYDSNGCWGEPIYMVVFTVDTLSLHAFDDVFYIPKDSTLEADVSVNDFDENGLYMIYNQELVSDPKNGTVTIDGSGKFTYIPSPGFVGIDSFVYEVNVYTSPEYGMSDNATVYIVVTDNNQSANLYIEKTGPAKALFGETIEYTIVVKNNGPSVAENVMLKDTIPFGLFNTQYKTSSTAYREWNGMLELGNINSGESVFVNIKGDISIFSPKGLWNQAITWSDNFDPDFSDNDSIWYTQVSVLYTDMGDFLNVPACDSIRIPNKIDGNASIASIRWRPSTGLNDSTIANPIFTPDESTIGRTTQFVLIVTDINGNVVRDTINLIVSVMPIAKIESDTMYIDMDERLPISGSESSGDEIKYSWWATKNHGNIVSYLNRDTVVVDTTGIYYLTVTDKLKCEASDSVLVLLESHPPDANNDYIDIVAGTDSSINVLDNDFDRNNFELKVTRILTEPKHQEIYSWDPSGLVTYTPRIDYWLLDSLEYEVCNNGYPVMCSSAWLYIHCLRPPRNADVVVVKTSDSIAFFGDSIIYNISIYNNGPDTTALITLYDKLNGGLIDPVYSLSLDKEITWSPWAPWTKGQIDFVDSLIPLKESYHLKIKAYLDPQIKDPLNKNTYIYNTAYINSYIVENVPESDTSTIRTKIKEMVIARAGRDRLMGECQDTIRLNGSASQGEEISFSWSPTLYLENPYDSIPVFDPPLNTTGTFTYILTITDNDGITDKDTVTVKVISLPKANAGNDIFLKMGEQASLDGRNSSGYLIEFSWTTLNGHIVQNTQTSNRPIVDALGTYILTVTDTFGCIAIDSVNVYRFYLKPVTIPDYYSTEVDVPFTTGNVLYNDYDPNGVFVGQLQAKKVVNMKTMQGGTVNINSNGTFDYTPPKPGSKWVGVDAFSYEVCSPSPDGCSRGYVKITVSDKTKICNLSIEKWVLTDPVLLGHEIKYAIDIKNKGEVPVDDITITDSLSEYISSPRYSYDDKVYSNAWDGESEFISLEPGDSIRIYIKGTIRKETPVNRILNAAVVSSTAFDGDFNWDDVPNRNVDTVSIYIENGLIANAQLVEMWDNNKTDNIIGVCDEVSYLRGDNSTGAIPIDTYEWLPSKYLVTPTRSNTKIKMDNLSDTTIIFTLIIRAGETNFKIDSVTVTISPEVKVDAGPDQKMNEGEPLTIYATGQGAYVTYEWNDKALSFKNDDPLQPIITVPGVYNITATDMHGCTADDYVTIRENELFALNDILVIITGDTVMGNVATNDYDPNKDSIYFTGVVLNGPYHGVLLNNPPGLNGPNGNNGAKISNNGNYIYSPDSGYTGADYFTYQIHDNNIPRLYASGTVFIKVIDVDSVNSPPVANQDVFFVNKNGSVMGNLLANDYDYQGGTIALDTDPVTIPQLGVVTLYSDSTFMYIPETDEVGADSFYYRISNSGVPTNYDTTMVSIYIHKVENENHRPVAVDDAYYVVENSSVTGNILLNDYDPDGNRFSFDPFERTQPAYGNLYIDSYGNFEYTPNSGFEGTDQVIYQINEVGTTDTLKTRATIYFTTLSEERYKTDLMIAKTGPEYALSGTRIQYTLMARNLGPSFANNIIISDTLFSELTKIQYSEDDGLSWKAWSGTYKIDQMLVSDSIEILIRAWLPDSIWEGLPDTMAVDLPNTAWVSHNMTELYPENNDSTWISTVYQKVFADAGIDTLIGSCITKYQLDASASFGMGTFTYHWSPERNLDDPGLCKPTYTTTPSWVQKFKVVVTSDYNGLFESGSDSAEVWVEIGNVPVADAGDEFWDQVDTVTLDGSGSMGDVPLTYSWWQYDKQNQVVVIDTNVITKVFKSGDYYLTVTDKFGCASTADLTHVGYRFDPVVAVDDYIETAQQEPTICIKVLRNDIIDEDDDFDMSLLIVTDPPKHGSVNEDYSRSDSCFIYTPEPYYIGYDTFTYSVSTIHGYDDAIVVIKVLEKPAIVPEGFSPNGDGINDYLIIENIEKYELNSIIIFNRWGSIVYKKSKYSNSEPWDGVANKGIRIGQGAVPAGIYLYILDLGDDRVNKKINNVTVNNRIVKGNIYVATDNR
jgi:gliding motility-associated-like protein/uncharacterized repeat protein (TIGR01451 family)